MKNSSCYLWLVISPLVCGINLTPFTGLRTILSQKDGVISLPKWGNPWTLQCRMWQFLMCTWQAYDSVQTLVDSLCVAGRGTSVWRCHASLIASPIKVWAIYYRNITEALGEVTLDWNRKKVVHCHRRSSKDRNFCRKLACNSQLLLKYSSLGRGHCIVVLWYCKACPQIFVKV